jgi:hypothetical protein
MAGLDYTLTDDGKQSFKSGSNTAPNSVADESVA